MLVSLKLLQQKPKRNQFITRKDLFWFTVLVVTIHDELAPLFWVCGEAVYYGGKYVMEQYQSPRDWKLKRKRGKD
jgi:hypothetical protein